MPEADSVAQLRREADKARTLADGTFSEEERRQLHEIAAALDREASAMEAALGYKVSRASCPDSNISL